MEGWGDHVVSAARSIPPLKGWERSVVPTGLGMFFAVGPATEVAGYGLSSLRDWRVGAYINAIAACG